MHDDSQYTYTSEHCCWKPHWSHEATFYWTVSPPSIVVYSSLAYTGCDKGMATGSECSVLLPRVSMSPTNKTKNKMMTPTLLRYWWITWTDTLQGCWRYSPLSILSCPVLASTWWYNLSKFHSLRNHEKRNNMRAIADTLLLPHYLYELGWRNRALPHQCAYGADTLRESFPPIF